MEYLTPHTSLSPIRRGFGPGFVNYKKRCTRLAFANDKVYQLFAHGQWFSPGTSASSTTNTDRHDIAEILLKVALKHQQKSINQLSRGEMGWNPINRYNPATFLHLFQTTDLLRVADIYIHNITYY